MNMEEEQLDCFDPQASRICSSYIEHHVSKLDTLAGIAIKYGVEVADIKRINGLVTDLHMFAHKTLKIPLPGRHPPASLPNTENLGSSGSTSCPRLGKHHAYIVNLQSELTEASKCINRDKKPVSLAISLLRGYYGLASPAQPNTEGMELTTYKSEGDRHSEEEPFSPLSASSTNWHEHKALATRRSLVNGNHGTETDEIPRAQDIFWLDDNETIARKEVPVNVGTSDIERATERSVRRRSKTEGVSDAGTRDRAAAVRKSPPRPRILSKASLVADGSNSLANPIISSSSNEGPGSGFKGSKGLVGTLVSGMTIEGLTSKVKKSSSTSNLQDETNLHVNSGSRCPSKFDLSNSNQASINQLGTLPFFEGLPKPSGNRRNKAALD